MRPATLLVFLFSLLLSSISSSPAALGHRYAPVLEEAGCPVVFDLVPFTDGDDPGRGILPEPCPILCQFEGNSSGLSYNCAMQTLNNLIRPFFIEIGHPALEETLTLLVAPHPTYGNNRLVISAPGLPPFIIAAEPCSTILNIYTSNGAPLEVSIEFDLTELYMIVYLSPGTTFTTRLKNCFRFPDNAPIEHNVSLRSSPQSPTTAFPAVKTRNARYHLPWQFTDALPDGAFRYSNPVREEMTLYFDEPLNELSEVMILSLHGGLIARHPAPAGTEILTVPLSQLASGVYALRVQGRNGETHETHIFIKL